MLVRDGFRNFLLDPGVVFFCICKRSIFRNELDLELDDVAFQSYCENGSSFFFLYYFLHVISYNSLPLLYTSIADTIMVSLAFFL